jgi:Tfp pilus assembly protein PilF
MRCRTSNTRWQASHSYSYVGTSEGYMGGENVSTRRGFALALSALLLAGCASTEVSQTDRFRAQAAYERGLGHMRERQPSAALGALKEAVGVDPWVAVYRDALGLVYLELGQPDLAIEQLRKAVVLDPKLADAHFHLGTAYAESSRWEEAVLSYRNALAMPTLGIPDLVHQNMGLALYHLKRYPEAESSLRFALSLDPKLQAGYYNLGLVLMAENRPQEARAAFRQARELAPETPFGQAAIERLKNLGEGG